MIIDGKKYSEEIKNEIKKEIIELKKKKNEIPCLVVILIGSFEPSKIYVRNKEKVANEVGIKSKILKYPADIKEQEILNKIKDLNNDKDVHGILVQLPLPKQINVKNIINSIDPNKDVDGFNPINVGNLASGYKSIVPCTPLGCMILIKKIEKKIDGKHAVIIGRSNLNGKPMSQLLLKENCTVTIVHSKTRDIKTECKKADILVVAAGVPNLVRGSWIKDGSIVIDVGINKINGKLVGDVHFDEAIEKARAITPVPGGVGPMTIACLLKNTLECFKDL